MSKFKPGDRARIKSEPCPLAKALGGRVGATCTLIKRSNTSALSWLVRVDGVADIPDYWCVKERSLEPLVSTWEDFEQATGLSVNDGKVYTSDTEREVYVLREPFYLKSGRLYDPKQELEKIQKTLKQLRGI